MGKPVQRITMFKVPNAENRRRILEQYEVMLKTAVKDGKPYILACEGGEAAPEPRAKGWTIAVKCTFASKEDMDYYDNECEAHREVKVLAKPLVEDLLAVWFEDVLAK